MQRMLYTNPRMRGGDVKRRGGALEFMEVNSTDSIVTNQWVAASAARAKPASGFEGRPLRGETSKVVAAAGGALPVVYVTRYA